MIVEFMYDLDRKVLPKDIPFDTTLLVFSHDYNYKLDIGSLSNNITEIKMGNSFNQKLYPGVLPFGLRRLRFGYKYNHRTFGKNHIEYDTTSKFNQIIEYGVLPPFLTHLTLSDNFNKPIDIDVLPHSLKYIVFGIEFDQPLIINDQRVLPDGILEVYFKNPYIILDPRAFPSHTKIYRIM